jgi:hypothetical protein
MNKPRGTEVECLKAFSENMKKILLVLTVLALVLPALPQARGDDVSVDFFYNNLQGGNWIDVEGYGYGWQPDLAVNDPNWRPYADGYWAYTDYGWTWISYEDFGWATYHYGRWASLADYGWVWFPGSDLDWGPAWVSWRFGGDYCGWAPLPPRGPGIVYEGGPIGARVDIDFDIGPEYYNFIDMRFIGEPVLRDRIFPVSQNVTYINNTVNVTNITVQNNVVYNYGPDYNVLSEHSSRPIQRLSIERQSATNLSAEAKSGSLTKVQGDTLVVAAPNKITKAAPGAAPPSVKTKVAQPKFQRGWTGVPNEAQLKEKIKTENPKNIPPPTRAAAKGQPPGGVPPAASLGASPFERGKRGRPGAQPGFTTAPVGSPGGISPAPFEKGKGKPGRPQPAVTGVPEGAVSSAPFERGRGRVGRPQPGVTGTSEGAATSPAEGAPELRRPPRGRHEASPVPPSGQPGETGVPPGTSEGTQPAGKQKGRPERGFGRPTPEQPGGAVNQPEQGQYRGRAPEQAATPPATGGTGPGESQGGTQRGQGAYEQQPGGVPATGEARGGRQRSQGAYGQPGGAQGGGPATGAERGQGKPEGGKKKGEKPSPTAGPR